MLFWKECKKTVCSLTFLIYAAAAVIMYISQFLPETRAPLDMPRPEAAEGYGSIEKEMPEILMPAAVKELLCEYLEGSYTAYPYGFYKTVRLKERDSLEMAAILQELTGLTREELDGFTEYEPENYEPVFDENGTASVVFHGAVLPEYRIPEQLSYEHFKELMKRADGIIGGGSRYSEQYLLSNFSQIPMTYEEALAEYEEAVDEKNVAETYARLYCDYMGIALGIFPVFVCAGLWTMDKRSWMEPLIYARKISSARLILTRYLAMVCSMALPVVITFAHALLCVGGLYPDKKISYVGALWTAAVWLLPELMTVSALGALISELISPFLAIFVQGVWWYASLEANSLCGSITEHTLLLRHNTLGASTLFWGQMENFLHNRAGYMLLSLLLAAGVALIYARKRKGEIFIWKRNLPQKLKKRFQNGNYIKGS